MCVVVYVVSSNQHILSQHIYIQTPLYVCMYVCMYVCTCFFLIQITNLSGYRLPFLPKQKVSIAIHSSIYGLIQPANPEWAKVLCFCHAMIHMHHYIQKVRLSHLVLMLSYNMVQ